MSGSPRGAGRLVEWLDGRGQGRDHLLDGLRGLAILLVLLRHGSPTTFPGGGILGVDLFFVLSGWLITSLLVREWHRTGTLRLGRFFAHRARRLLPALYAMFAVVLLATVALGADTRTVGVDALFATTYSFNLASYAGVAVGNGPLWTLSTEEQFYAVWPVVLIVLIRFRRSVRAAFATACALVVVVAVVRSVSYARVGSRVYVLPTTWADALLAGAALALAAEAWPDGWRRVGRVVGRWPVQALCWAAALGSVAVPDLKDGSHTYTLGLPLLAAAIVGILWGVLVRPLPVVALVLSRPEVLALGAISYSLYLYNYLVFQYLIRHHVPTPVTVVVGSALSVVLAVASRRWVELPGMRLGRGRVRGAASPVPVPRGGGRMGPWLTNTTSSGAFTTSSSPSTDSAPSSRPVS